jgi:cobalamin synthase
MSEPNKNRRWGLEHWQAVFSGLLVVIGVVYTYAAWLCLKRRGMAGLYGQTGDFLGNWGCPEPPESLLLATLQFGCNFGFSL